PLTLRLTPTVERTPVTDRSRLMVLSWAAVCFALFAVLTALVAAEWGPLVELDHTISEDLGSVPAGSGWADALRVLEVATGTLAVLLYTALTALVLLVNSHPRAAAYVGGVVVATMLATHLLKWLVGRERPDVQAWFGELRNGAIPSWHACLAAALAGALRLGVVMLTRRPR